MANLTISIDDDVLRRARIRAAEQGTSVNAVLRDELARYAGSDDDPLDALLRLSDKLGARSDGSPWSRDSVYEERLDQR